VDRAASSRADHEHTNRAFWDADADAYQAAHAAQLAEPKVWGVWSIPDSVLGVLGDTRGLSVLELGCGAAQWSAALASDGACVVALDQSRAQLRHAVAHRELVGAHVPLVCASGESIPLGDERFDVVFCDHGALSFCDPERIVPEVARVLRPGGRLVFNHATLLHTLCYDDEDDVQDDRLHRPYHLLGGDGLPGEGGRAAHRYDWGDGTIDFHLTYGQWIRCFRANGLVVEDLVELVPPDDAATSYDFVPVEWARRWPAEEIWVTRKLA
jgi:SAM-dependent methyltransferase